MRIHAPLFLLILILLPYSAAAQKAPPATLSQLSRSFEHVVERVGPAVVQILSIGLGAEEDSPTRPS